MKKKENLDSYEVTFRVDLKERKVTGLKISKKEMENLVKWTRDFRARFISENLSYEELRRVCVGASLLMILDYIEFIVGEEALAMNAYLKRELIKEIKKRDASFYV